MQNSGIDLQSLFRSLPGLFVVMEPVDFKVLEVSSEYLKETMLSRADLIGNRMFEVLPDDPNDPEAVGTKKLIASFNKVKNERIKDVMSLVKHPIKNPHTGEMEERYWAPENSPILNEAGELLYIVHSSKDVTAYIKNVDPATELDSEKVQDGLEVVLRSQELKKLNDEFRINHDRLQSIFRDASLGIAVCTVDGNITEANSTYCNMLGYTLGELREINVLEMTHPDDRVRNVEHLQNLSLDKLPTSFFEKRYIDKTGKAIWCRISASPLKNSLGETTSLIAIVEDISERKRAEEKLIQTETLARIAGKISRIGGLSINCDGKTETTLSEEVLNILEYEGVGHVSMDDVLSLLQYPHDQNDVKLALERCERRGEPFDLEFEIKTFKGKSIWARLAGEAEKNHQGSVCNILSAFQDISKRKETHKENQILSETLFETLETMSDAFYLLDKDWKFLYVNSESARILKVDRNEITGKLIWDCMPTIKQTPLYEGYIAAARDNTPYHLEYFSNNLQEWIEVHAYPASDRLAVYFRVTTENRKLIQGISESEKRLQYVSQATLDVAWDLDVVNRKIWWSDGLEAQFGYDLREVRDNTDPDYWVKVVHPDDQQKIQKQYRKILAGSENTMILQYRFICNDGTEREVEDRSFVIRNDQGVPVRIVGGVSDISERLNLEKQLRQSQRLESIGQLTGGVAHDFNNLLTVILGNSELLREEYQEDEQLNKLAAMISMAAERGADLTQRLLAFGRRQSLDPKIIDINELIRNMDELLSRTLDKRIEINLSLSEDLSLSYIDPNQLEAAVLNLCINARDAMPQGGALTIQTQNIIIKEHEVVDYTELKPGKYIVLAISDTGVGIPQEIQTHIFEPFFTTKEKGKGTGLGLSTVFGFLKQSDGHINLQSTPDSGTTFNIYLPCVEGTAEVIADRHEDYTLVGGNETILIVEDDRLIRQFAWEQLDNLGYNLLVAKDGIKALELINSDSQIDLLFTDVIMPGMDGFELAKRAREILPELKVLFTSGYTEKSEMPKSMLDGDIQILPKPYYREKMAFELRKILEN